MLPAEIEVRDEQRHGMPEIFNFLGIPDGQAGESALKQPNAQVGSFNVRSADFSGIGSAAADRNPNPNAWWRTVTNLHVLHVRSGGFSIEFRKLGEVHLVTEAVFH